MIRPIREALCALALLAAAAPTAKALTPVRFGLDWVAEPEYGGYYEALAEGLYQQAGLDVTIVQGGPQANNSQMLVAGRLDFAIESNAFLALNCAQQNLPCIAVAAGFQKDPDVLIAHPGTGHDSFAALKGDPIAVSNPTRASWWLYLKSKYGYSDSQLRTYNFSLTPFFTNQQAVQEAYATDEPYLVHEATGQWPVVLALPDTGFDGHASLIAAQTKLVRDNPDLVRRFIAASQQGWYDYLYKNPAPAFAAIKAANPDMTDGLMLFSYQQLKSRGIVDSGDAKTLGIFAMTDARWTGFFDQMVKAGLYDPNLNYKAAYTLRFVDQGVPRAP
ncbi:ABC transporter substrate-binding protein [Acidocella sp.]|uniref:ABC transporter substrate-binding protein n=1 Tax=Acidocella sp. TaxID=50710 RepID=UPI0026026B10|nr:ABC transporter substrate-binding protein [Acidocella sp.]